MYILIDDADEVKCKWGKCTKSLCCYKVCSSFDCPKYYKLIDDAYTTVCKDDKCTKDQCCEKGEMHPTSYRSSTGFGLHFLISACYFTAPPPVGCYALWLLEAVPVKCLRQMTAAVSTLVHNFALSSPGPENTHASLCCGSPLLLHVTSDLPRLLQLSVWLFVI